MESRTIDRIIQQVQVLMRTGRPVPEQFSTVLRRMNLRPGVVTKLPEILSVPTTLHPERVLSLQALVIPEIDTRPRYSPRNVLYEFFGWAPTPNMVWYDLFSDGARRSIMTGLAEEMALALAMHDRYLGKEDDQKILRRRPLVLGINHETITEWERYNTITVQKRERLPDPRKSNGIVF